MIRTTSRALLAALATSVALVTAACNSSTPPTPSPVAQTVAPASIAPTAALPASPNPTLAASPAPTASPLASGSWSVTGSTPRGHTFGTVATLLRDGRVLVAGGEIEGDARSSSPASDLYDPATGRWAPTGNLLYPRHGLTAILLEDGDVLAAGGWDYGGPAPTSEELYDPATGIWTATGAMIFGSRLRPVSAALLDGRILVAGGCCSRDHGTRRVELYDPSTGSWSSIRPTAFPADSATRLADGRVFVMEGQRPPELFDPASKRWTSAARPLVAGAQPTLLPNGKVLLLDSSPDDTSGAELYDPASDTWSRAGDPATGGGRATLLGDGTVLVVGPIRSARYDPGTGSWSKVPRPPLPVEYGLPSPDGVELNVLISLTDGRALATEVGSAALFDPNGG